VDLDLNKNNKTFKEYFHTIINSRVETFINELSDNHTTYLFSGVLRNYFLNIYEQPRDLDIVLKRKMPSSNLIHILNKYGNYKLNAFGGFKINIKGLSIDIWYIEDTWAIKNNFVKTLNEPIETTVLKSTFFNFSSILYNFKDNKFIYNKIFEDFYKSKTIDIVVEDNLSELLCLINIVYYSEKFELNLSTKVKQYFICRFKNYTRQNFDDIQIKHFNTIKYDYPLLDKFYKNLNYFFR